MVFQVRSSSHRNKVRLSSFGLAFLGIASLMGCQNQKIVARVNSQPITEEEFYKRSERISAKEMQAGQGVLDSGGIALMATIREMLTDQLAAKKNVVATPDEVNKFVGYALKRDPNISEQIRAGRIAQDDVAREVKYAMQTFKIGVEGAKADEAELKKEYESNKEKLKIPAMTMMRFMGAPDLAKAQTALAEIKKSGNYQKAAMAVGTPPEAAQNLGRESPVDLTLFDPASRDAINALNPSQFTEKPVEVTLTNPQDPTQKQKVFFIGQMIRKEKEYIPTIDEARYILMQSLLSKKQPDWNTHANQELAKFTGEADIQINPTRYKHILQLVKRQSASNLPTAPGGTMGNGDATPPPISNPDGAQNTAPPSKVTPPK